ncbi:ORF114 [Lymantria xylina nucleopolyhedrovirus]|uniref:ORF114 n=1 Tax=Lymantria xylina multiple nucleopolyhedrovirus TaxID=2847840 RepID=D4N2F1_9ABAC|nr:ORF114 [Lymantria xylina nucleopolyhedrovirus]ADD73823.1 ORF114 [Lymantria xylina nucleopolyhedrovirus]
MDAADYFAALTTNSQNVLGVILSIIQFVNKNTEWSAAESDQANVLLNDMIDELKNFLNNFEVLDQTPPADLQPAVRLIIDNNKSVVVNLINYLKQVRDSRSVHAGLRVPARQLRARPLGSLMGPTATALGLTKNQKVYARIEEYGRFFGDATLSEFKYEPELCELLSRKAVNRARQNRSLNVTLTRLDCAAVVAQALFFYNKPNLDFRNVRRHAKNSVVMAAKLLCLLHYIHAVCYLMRAHRDEVDGDVSLSRVSSRVRAPPASVKALPLQTQRVSVKVKDPEYEFAPHNFPALQDLTVIYCPHGRLGEWAASTARVGVEELLFLKFPELYALSYFAARPMADDESMVLSDLQHFNEISTAGEQVRYVKTRTDALLFQDFLAVNVDDSSVNFSGERLADEFLGNAFAQYWAGMGHHRKTRLQAHLKGQIVHDDADRRATLNTKLHWTETDPRILFFMEVLACSVHDYDLCFCVPSEAERAQYVNLLNAVDDCTSVEDFWGFVQAYVHANRKLTYYVSRQRYDARNSPYTMLGKSVEKLQRELASLNK